MALDPRIGRKNADGSIAEWPEKTISGRRFERTLQPVEMNQLDNTHFVVFDVFHVVDKETALKELRALLSAPAKPVRTEPTKADG